MNPHSMDVIDESLPWIKGSHMNPTEINAFENQILENWRDAIYTQPEGEKIVNCWTGRMMAKCKYNHERKIWVTERGLPIRVLMWEKEI